MTNYCIPNTKKNQYVDDTLFLAAYKNLSTANQPQKYKLNVHSLISKKMLQLKASKTEFVLLSEHANPGNLRMSIKGGEETIRASIFLKNLGASWVCDITFHLQIKATIRCRLFYPNLAPNQKKLSLNKATSTFKTPVLNQSEHPIFLFTGLFKIQINSLDRQIICVIKTVFCSKKIEGSSHLRRKHQIM